MSNFKICLDNVMTHVFPTESRSTAEAVYMRVSGQGKGHSCKGVGRASNPVEQVSLKVNGTEEQKIVGKEILEIL